MAGRKKYSTKPSSRFAHSAIIEDLQRIHPYLHSNFSRFLKRVAGILGFVAIVIGNTSLVINVVRYHFHNNTFNILMTRTGVAIAFILMGILILLLIIPKRILFLRIVIYFLSFLCLTISLFSLFNFSLTFREFVYPLLSFVPHDQLNFFFTSAFNAASILCLFSLGFILLQHPKTTSVGQLLTLLGILILLPTNIGYMYGSDFIYSISTSTKLAAITAVGFNIIGFALLFVKSDQGVMRDITGQTTGGFFARRFIPLAIISPLILGWVLSGGFNFGWYSESYRYLLLITSTLVFFLIWAFYISRSMQTLDFNRKRAEQTILFLSESSKILASSLDYHRILRKIADLAVPLFADWCTVEMVTSEKEIKHIAVTHKDHRRKALGLKLLHTKKLYIENTGGLHHVLQTGKAEMYPVITVEMLRQSVPDKKNLHALQKLGIHSAIIVPIIIHRKVVGAIQFVLSDTKRSYDQQDLQVAQELAVRAALAIENAQLYKNAKDAIKIRDEFMSMTSHELKTPLTTLKVYTEVLLKKFQKTDIKTAGYLQKMDEQITNLTSLIKDLLDVTRIQVGKLAFHFERMDLTEVVKDIVTNFQATTKHKISLNGKITHSIIADRERLRQLVINLLTNAVKYSPQADNVILTLSQTPTTATISVQDFGIGIDKKHISRIFDRFFQVGNKKGSNAGLGMGLYISREIVRRHGGTISVDSTKGKGTTFTITIPIRPPHLN